MSLAKRAKAFVDRSSTLDAKEAEEELLPILTDLLKVDGFELVQSVRPDPRALDYMAIREVDGANERIGIEYKHYSNRKVSDSGLSQILSALRSEELERVIILSRSGYDTSFSKQLSNHDSAEVTAFDYSSFLEWTQRAETLVEKNRNKIELLVVDFSRRLAEFVAENEAYLDQIEWRDIERLIAFSIEAMGFKVELTPPAKDGGKDIIVFFQEGGQTKSYIIEVKHWRSGKKVGSSHILSFAEVVARECPVKGVFISTSP